MKIIYKRGDLMKATEGVIMHGCNAQGVMGSGVARLVRDQIPAAYNAYRAKYVDQGNKLYLGQNIWVPGEPLTVINAITQEFYGADPNTVYVDYKAVESCMAEINGHDVKEVAMPLIGAGRANGDWKIISEIIEEQATDYQPVVYLDRDIPGGVQAEIIDA